MLAGALLGVWALVFLSLVFGKAVLAKVTWVTVVRPACFLHLAAPRAYLARALGPAPAPSPSPQPPAPGPAHSAAPRGRRCELVYHTCRVLLVRCYII